MPFRPEELEDILVCPKSKSALVLEEDILVCANPDCRRRYEIRDEIPVMLVEESVELKPEEWAPIMERHGRDPRTGAMVESD